MIGELLLLFLLSNVKRTKSVLFLSYFFFLKSSFASHVEKEYDRVLEDTEGYMNLNQNMGSLQGKKVKLFIGIYLKMLD